MATREEVEDTLRDLMRRAEKVDRSYMVLLPNHRVVEAEFPDLDLAYHAEWKNGSLSELRPGPAARPHVRIVCDSDDLLEMASGELPVRRAYAGNRLQINASMSDLLRLRSFL